jgi:hypothetical protein
LTFARPAFLAFALLATPCLPAQFGGYPNPAILNRPSAGANRSAGRPIRLRGYLTSMGLYTSGLTGASVANGGELVDDHSYGYSMGGGLLANYEDERSATSLDFSGFYNRFTRRFVYTGPSLFLNARHARQLGKRWSVMMRGAGLTQEIVFPQRVNPLAPDLGGLPDTAQEVFDNRLSTGLLGAGIGYQPSARLVLRVSGDVITAQRKSTALVSFFGGSSTGELEYLWSRRQSIGASYNYSNIFFRRSFGELQHMTWLGTYGRRLSPRWNLKLAAGVYRMDYERLQSVAVDPLITALTGQRFTLAALSGTRYGGAGSAQLGGVFRLYSLAFQYDRGVTPTNGVILAAEREAGGASFTYTGLRNLNVGLSAMRTRFKARFERGDRSEFWTGNGGLNYRLFGPLYLTGNYTYIHFTFSSAQRFARDRVFASFGVTLSPGEAPLPLF